MNVGGGNNEEISNNKGKISKLQKQSTTNFKGANVGFGGSK